MALSTRDSSLRRAQRTRTRLRKLANGRPRLSVFRSSKNIYAQVIDDERGVTLAAASTLEGDEKSKKGADKDIAAAWEETRSAGFDMSRLLDGADPFKPAE